MRYVNQFAVLQEKDLGFSSVKCFAFQFANYSFIFVHIFVSCLIGI